MKKSIKVLCNIWGNWNCYIGSTQVNKFSNEFDAQYWLNEQFATGLYTLSGKSLLKPTVAA